MPITIRIPPGEPSRLVLVVDDIAHRLGDESVEWGVGQQIFSEHAGPRRVTFVPTVGRFELAEETGYLRLLDTAVVSVTDADLGKTEQLFGRLLAAVFESRIVDVVAEDQDGTFEWYTEREGESGLMVRGSMIQFELKMRARLAIGGSGTGEVTIEATQGHCVWVPSLDPVVFPPYTP